MSQVPAFLISIAAGLLVSSTQKSNMPREFMQQIFSRPQALTVTGGFLAILVFTSLPRVPLLALGGACLGLARMMTRRESEAAESAVQQLPDRERSQQGLDGNEYEHGDHQGRHGIVLKGARARGSWPLTVTYGDRSAYRPLATGQWPPR